MPQHILLLRGQGALLDLREAFPTSFMARMMATGTSMLLSACLLDLEPLGSHHLLHDRRGEAAPGALPGRLLPQRALLAE